MEKLVRDKIPSILESLGYSPKIRKVKGEEYKKFLYQKLIEEVNEFIESEKPEELADILEVIYSICDYLGTSIEEIEKLRVKKKEERGGFKEGIVLIDH